jgi:hypothetical protein
MTGEIRLTQLSRILATPIADDETARTAINARPGDFASALFHEAADSDDVTSAASALDYLEDRLAYFGPLVLPSAAEVVRAAFIEHIKAWG